MSMGQTLQNMSISYLFSIGSTANDCTNTFLPFGFALQHIRVYNKTRHRQWHLVFNYQNGRKYDQKHYINIFTNTLNSMHWYLPKFESLLFCQKRFKQLDSRWPLLMVCLFSPDLSYCLPGKFVPYVGITPAEQSGRK